MLTDIQKKYISEVPQEKKLKIMPYHHSVTNVVKNLTNKIKAVGTDLTVKFLGSSALGISGHGDIDIYILCLQSLQEKYLAKLKIIFGHHVRTQPLIRWNFLYDGYEIDMFLIDPNNPVFQEQLTFYEMLKNNIRLSREYEQIKKSLDGMPFREYVKVKYEFFNKVLEISE